MYHKCILSLFTMQSFKNTHYEIEKSDLLDAFQYVFRYFLL